MERHLLMGGKGAFVAEGELDLFALTEDDVSEVDPGQVACENGFAKGADDGEGDPPSLGQDGELGEDVLVELREKFEADVGADARGYFALGVVLHLKVVLSEGGGTLILGGRGSTLKELKALDTFVIVMTW